MAQVVTPSGSVQKPKQKEGERKKQPSRIRPGNQQMVQDIIQSLRLEEFRPVAQCWSCYRELSPEEIIAGFWREPACATVRCPKCGRRVGAMLKYALDAGEMTLMFHCPTRTLDWLRGLALLSPDEIASKHPAVYRSALALFGSLNVAFARMGVAYSYDEQVERERALIPCLGSMPDSDISEIAGIPAQRIRQLRDNLGINSFEDAAKRATA